MTVSKFFALATIFVAAFTLGSCSKDDDDEVNNSKADGHEYVDLGLPSGTLWATCNVGASKPEEFGSYFAWAETQPKEMYSWSTYKWLKNNEITRYCIECEFDSSFGTVDNKTELLPEDDAATVNWGNNWRLPSFEQINELVNGKYTNIEWTTLNGVSGVKITSKKNGKSVFLPAGGDRYDGFSSEGVGYYLTRTLSITSLRAYYLCVDSGGWGYGDISRYFGQSARPVRK